jgi:hypothetical protein
VDRQKTLGHIPPNTPFLQAYKSVGDAMAQEAIRASGGEGQPGGASGTGQAQPQVLATRTAAPKQTVANGDRASAAAPTRTGSTSVKPPLVNPLAESDEAFLKRMENRL